MSFSPFCWLLSGLLTMLLALILEGLLALTTWILLTKMCGCFKKKFNDKEKEEPADKNKTPMNKGQSKTKQRTKKNQLAAKKKSQTKNNHAAYNKNLENDGQIEAQNSKKARFSDDEKTEDTQEEVDFTATLMGPTPVGTLPMEAYEGVLEKRETIVVQAERQAQAIRKLQIQQSGGRRNQIQYQQVHTTGQNWDDIDDETQEDAKELDTRTYKVTRVPKSNTGKNWDDIEDKTQKDGRELELTQKNKVTRVPKSRTGQNWDDREDKTQKDGRELEHTQRKKVTRVPKSRPAQKWDDREDETQTDGGDTQSSGSFTGQEDTSGDSLAFDPFLR